MSVNNIEPEKQKNAHIKWDTTGKKGTHEITVLIEDVNPEDLANQNNMASGILVVKESDQNPGEPPGPSEEPNHPPVINKFTAEPPSILLGSQCTLPKRRGNISDNCNS
jgi:hypothetical protein